MADGVRCGAMYLAYFLSRAIVSTPIATAVFTLIAAPIYNQIYAVKSANEEYSSFLRKEEEILLKDKDDVERSLNMLQARVSLLDLMNKYDGKIPEKDVNCYTQMMLERLLGVHEKGFIHSDLQPGNILNFPPQHCASLPTLKIVDFKLAKQQGVKDTRFGFQCTRYYMSPESIVEEVSGALNKWSLGCIVVEMITGILPWDTHDRDDLTGKLLRGESPNIPKDMSKLEKSFLRECFAIDPNKRWNVSKLYVI
ncbi:hypothetical protein Gogos_010758, partial [Gossypium gossypioides]|nr:hypothetical protein [Gossypium gossypioides]